MAGRFHELAFNRQRLSAAAGSQRQTHGTEERGRGIRLDSLLPLIINSCTKEMLLARLVPVDRCTNRVPHFFLYPGEWLTTRQSLTAGISAQEHGRGETPSAQTSRRVFPSSRLWALGQVNVGSPPQKKRKYQAIQRQTCPERTQQPGTIDRQTAIKIVVAECLSTRR